MKKHKHNGHGEHAVENRRHGAPDDDRRGTARVPGRGVPTHPPVRSVAVWGPIAVAGVLALFVVIGVWRHMRAHSEQEPIHPRSLIPPPTVPGSMGLCPIRRGAGRSAGTRIAEAVQAR